ncbi:MAG TPA: DUF4395 domain-containing protein, partial [Nitratifractor sp.]|nr:DUF4395 domain-containing protein [Nitratifractor sp.]
DARASAGIMFLLGTITLFTFIISKNLFWANLFTITFILEFLIRVFINPLYAPYMALGSLIVRNQSPEWVEAKPKKFAWFLAVVLGLVMSYFILFDIVTPARLGVCLLCLLLLFMESAFGICLGCIVYKKFNVDLQNCPGGVCETQEPRGGLKRSFAVVTLSALLFAGLYYGLKEYKYNGTTSSKPSQEQLDSQEFAKEEHTDKSNKCTPPQWAIDIGHKEMWLKHHGCKE